MQLFYAPEIAEQMSLPPEEARHCFQVLRHVKGDHINVTDGKGVCYLCEVINDNTKQNKLKILSREQIQEHGPDIVMAVAPTKSMDRMEWLTEKAVEIGVSEIQFIITQNSERRVIKTERVMKKAISAMKQSLKATLPVIHEALSWEEYLEQPYSGKCFIAHLDKQAVQLKDVMIKEEKRMCLAIGPEGGFTEEEVALAKEKGFESVQLGTSRLRTETACIVGLTILHQK